MATPLLLLLALAVGLGLGLAVGLPVGSSRGRTAASGRDERELSRVREELAVARAEAAGFRADAAESRVDAARADADVAAALAQRDAAQQRAAEIAADREAMVAQFKVLSAETAERQGKAVESVTTQRLQATEQLLAPVASTLRQFEARLTEVEKERVQMSTDLRAHVRSVRDTGEALRKETATLVTALRKPQVRGAWGETTLKRVVELAGMVEHCDFDTQLTAQHDGKSLRPDLRVHLGHGKVVFVDSKVPLSAFLDAAEAEDDDVRAGHLASFARHVRTHVDQLSAKKYWKVDDSPEFVVLFLPSEAFFAAALEQIPDLYEYAGHRDVVIATPTSLIGLLRAVSYGWKQAGLAETAAEVAKLGRELHERLGLMGARFDKLGRALRSSVTAYNETVATVEGRVLVQARRLRDLKVTEADLAPLGGVDDVAVRELQAPELVEDAARVTPVVGRGARSRREPPEADALWRTDPELDELLEAEGRSDAADDVRRLGT